MKRIWVVILTAMTLCPIGFCPSVSALNLKDLVGGEKASALLAGEKPVYTQLNSPKPEFLPSHEILKNRIEAIRKDLDPGVMVETLHVYKKPGVGKSWNADEQLKLYNSVLALSTLAGLQYYSASRGVMRTFYESSSVIDGPSSKKPLPDPVYPMPPAELTLYARQKDLTFGDNIYQYVYYSVPDAIIFIQENLTALNAGIIPAVGKNKLRSVVAVLDAEDCLLVYAASMAKAVSLPGMRERIGNSFANRAEALFRWFSDQADKAYRQVQ